MLRIIICVIFVAVSATGLAQENFEGVYFCNENRACKVVITGDKFYYVESLPKWTNDTLADFYWKRVNDRFIKVYISDICYDYDMRRSTKTQQFYDSLLPQSHIRFRFFMNETKDLKVFLHIVEKDGKYISKTYDFIYSNDNREIVVPKPGTKFSFTIEEHISNIQMHDSLGVYYGSNFFYRADEYIKSQNINLIEIHIPFDYSYFEKYYTVGEFVRVHNDTLTWKGRTFVKSE